MYLNAGYFYRPWVAFNSGAFAWNLFVRPGYGHYYVGNYWGNRYNQFGYRPWFAYNQGRSGYDPFYNYYRWSNGRNNPGWDRDLRNAYAQRNRGDFDRPRDFNAYRSQLNRIDARDRTALTVAQLQQERRDGTPRLVRESARDREQFRDASRQFRELNERRRDTEIAGANRNPAVDRARGEANRGPRSEVASRGQLNLPPTDRTRTPSPRGRNDQRQMERSAIDRSQLDRSQLDRSQVNRSRDDRSQIDRPQIDRGGRTAGQERSNRNQRTPREFTNQPPRTREGSNPRSTQSFRANPNSGRGETAIPRELQSRDRSGGDRGSRSEFQPRTPAPDGRTRIDRSPAVRSNPGSASSRATQEFQSRARNSVPAARTAPPSRSFESRARSGGGEARSSRAPQNSFRSAPSSGDRGGGARSTPNFSSPRGGGGSPAARAPSGGGGGGGGNRGGGNQGGGGGGGGGGGRRGGR